MRGRGCYQAQYWRRENAQTRFTEIGKPCRALVCLTVPVSVLTVNNLFWVPEEADDYPWETNPNICDAGWGSKFWKGSAAITTSRPMRGVE